MAENPPSQPAPPVASRLQSPEEYQQKRKSALRTLPQRVISSIVAFALLVMAVWFNWPLAWLVAATVSFGLYEYRSMVIKGGLEVGGYSMYVFGLLMVVASTTDWLRFFTIPVGISWREAILGLYFVYLMVSEVIKPRERALERVAYSMLGVLWIPFLLTYALLMRDISPNHIGFWYTFLPILAAFSSDTGGFFAGVLLGRRKLAPEISPSKTVEGSLGGIGLSFITTFALTEILRIWFKTDVKLYDALLYSILVSSAAQLGDLVESVVKRSFGVKDSGTFLPGHGGLLDRIDSLIFAVPVAYYFVAIVVPG
jgi:phosphatidate cytidylyltransferase